MPTEKERFEVLLEEVNKKFDTLTEGQQAVEQKIDNRFDELNRKFEELKHDNELAHKDILSGIKFSYADVDKRITQLEARQEGLEKRVGQLEAVK